MNRFFLVILSLLLVTSCSSGTSTVYNDTEISAENLLFSIERKIVYKNLKDDQWMIYDTEELKELPLMVKQTSDLNFKNTQVTNVYPTDDRVQMLEYRRDLDSWVVFEVNLKTMDSRQIGRTRQKSLIDTNVSDGLYVIQRRDNPTLYCDPFNCELNSGNIYQKKFIYNNSIYHTKDAVFYKTDLNGNSVHRFPFELNTYRQDIALKGSDIYFIDPMFNLIKFNQGTKENELVLSNVSQFKIEDNNIIYESIEDQYYNKYDFDTKKKLKLIKGPIQMVSVFKDKLYYLNDFVLYEEDIYNKVRSTVNDTCISFMIKNKTLYILTLDGKLIIENL